MAYNYLFLNVNLCTQNIGPYAKRWSFGPLNKFYAFKYLPDK